MKINVVKDRYGCDQEDIVETRIAELSEGRWSYAGTMLSFYILGELVLPDINFHLKDVGVL